MNFANITWCVVLLSACMAQKHDMRSTTLASSNAKPAKKSATPPSPPTIDTPNPDTPLDPVADIAPTLRLAAIADVDFTESATLPSMPISGPVFFSTLTHGVYASITPTDLATGNQCAVISIDTTTFETAQASLVPKDATASYTFQAQALTMDAQIFGRRVKTTPTDTHFTILESQTGAQLVDTAADTTWLATDLTPACHTSSPECYVVEVKSPDARIRALSTADLKTIRTANLAQAPLYFGLTYAGDFFVVAPSTTSPDNITANFIGGADGKVTKSLVIPAKLGAPNMTFMDNFNKIAFVFTETATEKAWYAIDINAQSSIGKIPFSGVSTNRGTFLADDSGQWFEIRGDGTNIKVLHVDSSKIYQTP